MDEHDLQQMLLLLELLGVHVLDRVADVPYPPCEPMLTAGWVVARRSVLLVTPKGVRQLGIWLQAYADVMLQGGAHDVFGA